MKRLIFRLAPLLWILFFGGLIIVFITREEGELKELNRLLRAAKMEWLLLAILIEISIIALMVFKHQLLLRRLDHQVGLLPLLDNFFRNQLLSTVIPVGGLAANVQNVRYLGRRGVSADRALFASLLYSLLGTLSVIIVAVPVLTWLAIEGETTHLILLGTGILLILVLVFCAAVAILLRAADPPDWLWRRVPARGQVFVADARTHGITARDLVAPLSIALMIDLLGGVMLYTVLRSIGVHPPLSTAFGGYLVGTVFMLIAPVFQGLGIVEFSMAVALQHFGVSAAEALGATLLYRFCELWFPFLVALAIQSTTSQGARALPPRLPAIVTGLTGVLSILSVIAPMHRHRFDLAEDYSRLALAEASRTLTLVAGFLLILLSMSLIRRLRVAWIVSLVLLTAITVSHLLKGHDEVVALISGANVALLLIYRKRFRVRSDIPTIQRGFAHIVVAFILTIGYGTAGLWFLDKRDFGINFSWWEAGKQSVRLLFSFGSAGLHAHTRHAAWFLSSFTAIAVVALIYAAFSVIRPVVWRTATHPADQRRARRLIEQYGDSSLDEFKSWDDKVYFFPSIPDSGVVSFGLAMGSAITLGDPVARDDAAFDVLLDEFLDFCDGNGWRVAFHQCPPTRLAAYRARGLTSLKIGEDAVVDLRSFALSGGHWKSMRSTLNKLDREGFKAIIYEAPLTDEVLARVRAVSDAWLEIPGRRERGFTLGAFQDDYVRRTPVMTVEDADGVVCAFANLIRDGAPGEATIDLMRRREHAPDGVMDFLFLRLMLHLKAAGYTGFSLGMAPFAEVGTSEDDPMLERGIHILSEHLTRFFSYKGLHNYKAKFQPTWEPRYLIYQSEVTLPAVTLALVRLTEGR